MAELSNIAAELSKGKNVDMNLSKYADGMNSLYGRMGYVKLALNLYSFAEVYRSVKIPLSARLSISKLSSILNQNKSAPFPVIRSL